ncbi:MAG: hypothetical protein MJZ76_04235 [Bacteroidales bacterium]|nr:hypothetical protein [Bacteroidales bacterium]
MANKNIYKEPNLFKPKYPANPSYADFVGSCHNYFILGIKSDYDILRLSHNLFKNFGTKFQSLGDYELKEANNNAKFWMSYSHIDPSKQTELLLLENKTLRVDQNFVDKSEANKTFHTLSLFPDLYYIFNPNGLHLMDWAHVEIDYLAIFITDKDENIDEYLPKFDMLAPHIKYINVTDELLPKAPKNSPKELFIKKLLFNIGEFIRSHKEYQIRKILVENKKIPAENALFAKSVINCFNDVQNFADIQNIEKYIELLAKDPTFE